MNNLLDYLCGCIFNDISKSLLLMTVLSMIVVQDLILYHFKSFYYYVFVYMYLFLNYKITYLQYTNELENRLSRISMK